MRLHRLDVVFMIIRESTRLVRESRSFRDGAVPTQELYELLKREGVPYEPNTGSDCEVLIPLYVKFGLEKACSLLRGARRPNRVRIHSKSTKRPPTPS